MSYFRWLVGLQASKLARRRDMLMELINNFREHRQQKTLALAARAETYERIWSRLGFHSRTGGKIPDPAATPPNNPVPFPETKPNEHLLANMSYAESANSTRSILDRLPSNWRELYMQQNRDAAFSNAQRLNRVRHINKVTTNVNNANNVVNLPALTAPSPLEKAAKKVFTSR